MACIAFIAFWALAIFNWRTVSGPAQEDRTAEHITKPAVLAALLLFAATGSNPSLWLIAALAFSLLGDVYLMLPGNLLRAGLVAFLLAHLAYIADFDAGLFGRLFWFLVVGAAVYSHVSRILYSIEDYQLRNAATVYVVVIVLMVASAIASWNVFAILGALLFLFSDMVLAWNLFVKPVANAHAIIMVAYHVGQFFLVAALRSGG